MAKKITAYSCEHKCGRNVLTSRRTMEEHESRCFYNPINKACVTCKFFESHEDSNGMEHEPQNLQTWRHNECEKGIDVQEKLKNNCGDYSNSK